MCGRSSLHDDPTNILERFSLPSLPGFEPHYNIAPTQLQWSIIRDGNGAPEVRQLKWGLVPSWANDPSVGNRMINARAESLTEKPGEVALAVAYQASIAPAPPAWATAEFQPLIVIDLWFLGVRLAGGR